MGKQKKLTNEIGDFNWVGGVTEAESLFLPKMIKGRKELDIGFESIYDYDLLIPIITRTQIKFNDDVRSNIGSTNLNKINLGIKDYILSTRKKSDNLDLLKASILNALGDDYLTYNYDNCDDDDKQIISKKYFEKNDDLLKIEKSLLIDPKSILYYKNKACEYSINALEEFSSNFETPDPYIYKGIGNITYYKNNKKDNSPDFISTYTGIIGKHHYFESRIFTSYSINQRVAEHFMMSKNNTRKAIIKAEKECIWKNIFSSFLVSDLFEERQYELLCLPNANNLYIIEDVNDSLCAEYYISDTLEMNSRMIRKSIDEK